MMVKEKLERHDFPSPQSAMRASFSRFLAGMRRISFVFAAVFAVTMLSGCEFLSSLLGNGNTENTSPSVVVVVDADSPSIKAKFGIETTGTAGVTDTFNVLHTFIAGGGLSSQQDTIRLGDWIDLEGGLTVAAYGDGDSPYTGGFTASNSVITPTPLPFDGYDGKLLRLIVVGINSFHSGRGIRQDSIATVNGETDGQYSITANDNTPHVVFQFQNVPGKRRMNPNFNDTGGYRDSEMREYLATTNGGETQNGNFLTGLTNAGVPLSVLWAPKRIVSVKEADGSNEISDLLWLPTEREMFGARFYSVVDDETENNQARLEYYTDNDKREKFDATAAAYWYWLASPHSDSTRFCNIDSSPPSGPTYNSATNTYGIAPAFCVQ